MIKTMILPNDIIQEFVLEKAENKGLVEDCCCTNMGNDACCQSSPIPSHPTGPMHLLQQRSTRVRFAETIKEHEIQSLNNYTNSELRSSWYSSKEKKAMSARREKMLAQLESGKRCNEDKTTYRGLECWTTEGAEELSDNINLVIQVVLQEQERQLASGLKLDAKLIAATSQAVTGLSLQRALQLAQTDESEATRINLGLEQDTFVDGISWYRPQKRGKRRRVKHDTLSGNKMDCRSRRISRRPSLHFPQDSITK